MLKIIISKKKVKFYCLQDPSETNGDKKEYFKDNIDELATNSKNKNIRDLYRGINDFKRGYQPRSKLVKDENGDLLAGRWFEER
jgi:hypothetical protein